MLTIKASGGVLGATITGVDLAKPLAQADFAGIFAALGEYGVLCFPNQKMDAAQLRDFARPFGDIQRSVTGKFCDALVPEVGLLSNIRENGEPIGLVDAGQEWHTDMSYNQTIGFTNVLYGVKVPRRDGRPLGATCFANMHMAYDDLADELKERLKDVTVTHSFPKFWDNMLKRGSTRPPLTEAQRRSRPPSVHPLFLTHPITGRKVLYCNPGFAVRINELPEDESDRVLEMLYAHELQPKYQYTHTWTERDVLMWDHIGTLHKAIGDYGSDQPRLMMRCQVMADKVFDPAFVHASLQAQ